jgi:hypothetical protein
MASLQESVICGLNMGRGANSIATNTIFGKNAGGFYTSGVHNSSIGYGAGRSKTANGKVSLGYKAGFLAQYGFYNVFVGSLVGVANYSGPYNVMVGQNTGYFTSYSSVGIGRQAFRTGNPQFSVAIGNLATCGSDVKGTSIGNQAGKGTTYGTYNVNIGEAAGQCRNGSKMTSIGACAGRFVSGYVGQTQVGYYVYGVSYQNYATVLGKYGNANAYVYVGWSNVSDSRDKTNIQDLPNNLGINFIRKLRPVSFKFDYRKEYMFKCGCEFGEKDGTLKRNEINYGFLAQEIEQAAKDLDVNFDGVTYDKWEDKYGLKMLELVSPIIKSIQELNNELDILEQQIK